MDKIKTVQPYKLYKKIFQDKSKAKVAVVSAVVLLLIMCIIDAELALPIVLVLVLLGVPLMIYNPMLKKEYEPGKSYSWVKDSASGKPTFVIKWLPIIGLIGGLIADIAALMFPVCTLIAGGGCALLAFLVKKNPEKWMDQESRLRMENHQDVDYNVKVDLNDIYGVNDKLILSYQNFNFEKERMEDGDYLLGVSSQGVYFIGKNQTVTKTKINFDEIDTLGLLAAVGNVYVFNIISKQNVEINIIVNQNDSLVVSPVMLFNTLLNSLDSYIQNGGVVTNNASRRRRVVVNDSTPATTSNDTAQGDSRRNIELEETTGSNNEDQVISSSNRVVDIAFSQSILEEMAGADYVESNRKIEL